MRREDKLNIRGHLEIIKVYSSGKEEVHWADHNVIVSGMGVGLAYLFSNLGSSSILDYQIKYVQLGVSGSSDYGVSTFKLTSSLPDTYLQNTSLPISIHSQYQNGGSIPDEAYITIPAYNIQRASPTSVRFNIVIPEEALNISEPMNEIGLFMKNPRGLSPIESILVAYRYFTPLDKTSDFSILFRWTLHF